MKLSGQKGVALTAVVIILIMLGVLSAIALNLAYNQRRLVNNSGAGQTVAYYRARGGLVDAYWRLQNNVGPPPDNTPGFWGPAVQAAYNLDIDGNGADDTGVTVGLPAVGTNVRSVTTRDL